MNKSIKPRTKRHKTKKYKKKSRGGFGNLKQQTQSTQYTQLIQPKDPSKQVTTGNNLLLRIKNRIQGIPNKLNYTLKSKFGNFTRKIRDKLNINIYIYVK